MTIERMEDGQFIAAVAAELVRARQKFPAPNNNLAALTEEVGDLAKAMLEMAYAKTDDWRLKWAMEVDKEAVQVAAMALRCATEGDPSLAANGAAQASALQTLLLETLPHLKVHRDFHEDLPDENPPYPEWNRGDVDALIDRIESAVAGGAA